MDIRKIDALELLQSLESKSVDVILTDPPYYKLLKVEWDNQWKTKEEYLEWLEGIIKECQRVLKDNGSFYMFCSACMSWEVEGVIRRHFNVLNHIRWRDKEGWGKHTCKEELRKYINNSEEIIFAEQDQTRPFIFEPIRRYLNETRRKAGLASNKCDKICGNQMAGHYFGRSQWALPTEEHYNKLKQHMDLKPYEEIKAEYESLRRTFKLAAYRP